MGDTRLAKVEKVENTVAKVSFCVGQISPHDQIFNFHANSVRAQNPGIGNEKTHYSRPQKGFFKTPLLCSQADYQTSRWPGVITVNG